MAVPFDLTCWYLNARRIAELVGMEIVAGNVVATSDQMQRLAELDALRRSAIQWIAANAPEPVEKLIVEEALREGSVVTLHSNFFFKGLSAFDPDNPQTGPLPSAYAKLDQLKPELRLTFDYHPEHLTSMSAWNALKGQARMFLMAVVTQILDNEIKVQPYVIGNLVEQRGALIAGPGRWLNHLEVHIDQIDSFALVEGIPRATSKRALDPLKSIPEQDVKEAIAEIIGEAMVPKDWGGEKSDMFSSGVMLEGRRISTAFALKGPAKFRPMTMAELGKNGDQINRLYEEPADLLVLQHCHEITPPVRRVMRAFAQQMGNPRSYCVIDGYDTLRLLTAYGKCGLGIAP